MTEQDQLTHDRLNAFDKLYNDGHTKACGLRQVWGDWLCSCEMESEMTRGAKEIRRVAELALFKVNLPENAAKSSWRLMSRRRLYWLLLIEVWELGAAMWALHRLRRRYNRVPCYETIARRAVAEELDAARLHVQHEAGDVVAFCAFLVDQA